MRIGSLRTTSQQIFTSDVENCVRLEQMMIDEQNENNINNSNDNNNDNYETFSTRAVNTERDRVMSEPRVRFQEMTR